MEPIDLKQFQKAYWKRLGRICPDLPPDMRLKATETAAYFVDYVEERRQRALEVPNTPLLNHQVRIWLTKDKALNPESFSVAAGRPPNERLKAILGEQPVHAPDDEDSPAGLAFQELEDKKERFRDLFEHGLAYEFCEMSVPAHHKEELIYGAPVPQTPTAPQGAVRAVARKNTRRGADTTAAATAAAAAAGAAVDEGGGPSPKPQEPKPVNISAESVQEWQQRRKPVDTAAELRSLTKLAQEVEESETFRPG